MTVIILLAVGVTTLIARFRGGMIALSAVLLVLLMDTANTFLYFNHIQGLTGELLLLVCVFVSTICAGNIVGNSSRIASGGVGWQDALAFGGGAAEVRRTVAVPVLLPVPPGLLLPAPTHAARPRLRVQALLRPGPACLWPAQSFQQSPISSSSLW
jgi:hypothetical protein